MAAFRNKVETVWSSFFDHMLDLSVGGTAPFRKVIGGETTPWQYEHPFIAVQLLSMKPISRSGQDKKWECTARCRVTTTATGPDGGITVMAQKIADANDHIEGYTKPDGVAGFENMDWAITDSIQVDDGKALVADSTFTFTVMVTRAAN